MSAGAASILGRVEPGTARGHGGGGPASTRITVAYGFWIFLLSDIIMFSTLFATYAVLKGATAGGPDGRALFELKTVGYETACLLFSSYTCGIGFLSAERHRVELFYGCFAITFLLGAAFLGFEASEFARMVAMGAGPARSAFLSAFFSLVGLHGLHVTVGLLWLVYLVAQTAAFGLKDFVCRRLHCFSLFWHALDIIWVALFTLVYLMGVQ